jgi:hypothetical protein
MGLWKASLLVTLMTAACAPASIPNCSQGLDDGSTERACASTSSGYVCLPQCSSNVAALYGKDPDGGGCPAGTVCTRAAPCFQCSGGNCAGPNGPLVCCPLSGC